MELFDEDKKVCGRIKFSTELKWVEYIPLPPTEKLDDKTMIKIIIIDATFLKDGDTFGKQDPFVEFAFGDKTVKTDVIDDGGLYAKFDTTFLLPGIINL